MNEPQKNLDKASALMYEIISVMEESDDLAHSLEEFNEEIFSDISIRSPKLKTPELGFIYSVSWLYVLYFEVGKIDIQFLNNKFPIYNLNEEKSNNHIEIVHHLRTFFHHNLNPTKKRNLEIERKCKAWFRDNCNTSIPKSGEQWLKNLIILLENAVSFLKNINVCIRKIEQDSAKEEILNDWRNAKKRHHPPYKFDRIIEIVASDMGREEIDVIKFRNKYYDNWIDKLKMINFDYDFETEARKMIEYSLLSDPVASLPLTGNDIMKEFGIEPGPEVGNYLEKAFEIYRNDPCDKKELLDKISEVIN